MRRVLRLAGAVLLAAPFVPISAIFGESAGLSALVPPGEWILGIAIFGCVAWLVAAFAGERLEAAVDAARARVPTTSRAAAPIAGAAMAALLATVSALVFRHRPLLVDSVVQLFQAKIFSDGMVAAPLPVARPFFATLHMVFDASGWYSQYPPGHALLLVPGVLAGAPWVVPVVLSTGSFAFVVAFTATVRGRGAGWLAGAALLLCPFFWFMGASFMNHVSTLFFLSAFLLGWARWERSGSAAWILAGGAALGGAFLSRPLTAFAVGVVFAVETLASADLRRRIPAIAGAVAAFFAVASIYPLYNAATTGDPFLPGYVRLWGADHGLGFHASPWGQVHTAWTGLRNELTDLSLLNGFLFEWPVPALAPVGLFLLLGGERDAWDRRLTLAFLALPAVYFFYWHRDAYLGPRYLYSGVAFLVPLTVRAVTAGWERLGDVRIGRRGTALSSVPARGFGTALIGLSVLYALGWGIPQRFVIYATGLSSMKVDLLARAEAAGLEPGLVFVKTSWGNRLIAEIYGLGVSASAAEKAYRRTDHCRLREVVQTARREGWPAGRVESALGEIEEDADRLVATAELNGDPTLRVDPDRRLTEGCVDEIRYDREGYTVYIPHLTANDPRLEGPWIVARDLRDRNRELRERYPGRPAYRYAPGGFERLEDDGGP